MRCSSGDGMVAWRRLWKKR